MFKKIFLVTFSVIWLICVKADEETGAEKKPQITPATKFDELFRLRFKHDVTEATAIIKKTMDLKKAQSMVEKVLSTVTKDMEKLRQEQLLKVPANPEGLLAGTVSETDIDAFVNLATDLLVFSNVILYQPDLSRDYLKKESKKEDSTSALNVIQWAVAYCRETGMFTNHTNAEKVVNLMEQELELVPRDANYQNPFAHRFRVERAREQFEEQQKELEKSKGKVKKPIKKEPRMSNEL